VLWGSTNRYRNSPKPDSTIARELNVDGLVRASVVRVGDSVHLQVRLIQARPVERLLWAQAYDRDVHGVLAMHREAANAIARAAAAELPNARNLPRQRAVNSESYEAYLRGMYYIAFPHPDSQRKALTYLQEAIDKNPGDALAYAGLAHAYASSAHSPFPLPDALSFGRAAALRAVTLDSTLAEAWAAQALVKLYLEWDWAGAERSFRRANDLNPNLAVNHFHYAWYLELFDRLDEAIAEHKVANALDPFNPAYAANLGILYLDARRYDDAIAEARKATSMAVRRGEGYALALDVLAAAFGEQGKRDQSILLEDSARRLSPGLSMNMVSTLMQAGRSEDARRVQAEVEATPVTPIGALNRAIIHGQLGDNDGFFHWIEYEPHHAWVPWIRVARNWTTASLRKDPRFALAMRRMNLPMPHLTVAERP